MDMIELKTEQPATQRSKTAQALGPPLSALHRHWPEYLMEGAELGIFMVVACLLAAVID